MKRKQSIGVREAVVRQGSGKDVIAFMLVYHVEKRNRAREERRETFKTLADEGGNMKDHELMSF